MSPAERVARGAALLDEQRPGWWERTDVVRLDMTDGCGCILGQEFQAEWEDLGGPDNGGQNVAPSPYIIGAEHLLRAWDGEGDLDTTRWAVTHGFDATFQNQGADFVALRAEWVRVIAERRAGSSS